MTIPLDRLYHFINNTAEEIYGDRVLIYRFYPHGSKNIDDLSLLYPIQTWKNLAIQPNLYCNDQEPLNFELYENIPDEKFFDLSFVELIQKLKIQIPKFNFRRWSNRSIWDSALLLHSEQRSQQCVLYEQKNFIPVYYWTHALISRDWFRYAEHCNQKKQIEKTFLIYNRAWQGTREYRVKFAEMLVQNNLVESCNTAFNVIDPNLKIHYNDYNFNNIDWKPTIQFENVFDPNTFSSSYSADFNLSDYEKTQIEVVLETLFDDQRLHITEKTLRSIACGQPFILAATHGSLKYLKNYGFKTFDSLWDETYDSIVDPLERLNFILNLMKSITHWNESEKKEKIIRAQKIADYNKKHFFSDNFFQMIIDELKNNLATGFSILEKTNKSKNFVEFSNIIKQTPELSNYAKSVRSKQESMEVAQIVQKYQSRLSTTNKNFP